MTLPPYALKYKDCTTEELNQFVRQRLGPQRRGLGPKKCIKKLKQLDAEQTFPFLKLLPELRNRLYDLVLSHKDEKRRAVRELIYYDIDKTTFDLLGDSYAETSLLLVNRQIYGEGIGYFMSNSTAVYPLYRQTTMKPMEVENLTIFISPTCFPTPIDPYPALERNARMLRMILDNHSCDGEFVLYKSIKVILLYDDYELDHVTEFMILGSLKPLKDVPPWTKLELHGFGDELGFKVMRMQGRSWDYDGSTADHIQLCD